MGNAICSVKQELVLIEQALIGSADPAWAGKRQALAPDIALLYRCPMDCDCTCNVFQCFLSPNVTPGPPGQGTLLPTLTPGCTWSGYLTADRDAFSIGKCYLLLNTVPDFIERELLGRGKPAVGRQKAHVSPRSRFYTYVQWFVLANASCSNDF